MVYISVMPCKTINDYVFYKIVNVNGDVDLCYVGSTANFKERVRTHRTFCNNEKDFRYNLKLYKTIREHGGWDEFKMVEIGRAEQLTKTEARKIEEEYRVAMKANMNTRKCFTEKGEYYIDNADKIREKAKQYYAENADKSKEKVKQYYAKNAEKKKEQAKQYQIANADKIREKRKEKITCDCGGCYTRSNKSQHLKTQKHQDYINNKVID